MNETNASLLFCILKEYKGIFISRSKLIENCNDNFRENFTESSYQPH